MKTNKTMSLCGWDDDDFKEDVLELCLSDGLKDEATGIYKELAEAYAKGKEEFTEAVYEAVCRTICDSIKNDIFEGLADVNIALSLFAKNHEELAKLASAVSLITFASDRLSSEGYTYEKN